MEIKTYFTDDKTKPVEYVIEAKFTAREKELAFRLLDKAIWIVNPEGDPRPAEED